LREDIVAVIDPMMANNTLSTPTMKRPHLENGNNVNLFFLIFCLALVLKFKENFLKFFLGYLMNIYKGILYSLVYITNLLNGLMSSGG